MVFFIFFLKMEAIRSSKPSVHTRSTQRNIPEDGILHPLPEDGGDTFLRNVGSHKITRHHIPQDGTLQSHRCEDLKSYTEGI
jgi:hypothetical protein